MAMHTHPLRLLPLLLLAACTVPSVQDDSSASRSSSVMSEPAASSSSSSEEFQGPPPMDQTSHSGTFLNTEFGFSLEYPTHFEPLGTPHWPVYRLHNARIVNNTLEHDQQPALFARSARDREVPSEFSMALAIYPLEGYSYVNIYDDEYVYNLQNNTWTKAMANEPFTPKTRTYNGLTMYEFTFGDAGHFEHTFAILNPSKNIVIEISAGGCLGCVRGTDSFEDHPQEFYDAMDQHANADTELILESFRWIEE